MQTTQTSLRPDVVELGVGQPDPELLPREEMREATGVLLASGLDWAALAYGANAGPETLRHQLSQRIATTERAPSESEILITGGNSQALDQLCSILAKPGDAVLVESPSYNFALQILRDHKLQLVPVSMDSDGLIPTSVDEEVRALRRKRIRPAFLYTIPTFHNPTGISLAPPRRHELVAVAASHGLAIVEDDVYRDLVYDGSAPPSLWELDESGSVIRLGTFSKILAPGLRVGWMTAPSALIKDLTNGGLRMSGGGVSHFSSMAIAAFIDSGQLEPYVEKLRTTYRARRDGLSAALTELIPEVEFELPAGGFFLWMKLPSSIDAQALLVVAETAGVAYVPGAHFYTNGDGIDRIRASFSMYPVERLREGIACLKAALVNFQSVRNEFFGAREEPSPAGLSRLLNLRDQEANIDGGGRVG